MRIEPTRARLLHVLCAVVLPVILFAYSSLNCVTNFSLVAGLRMSRRVVQPQGLSLPCFSREPVFRGAVATALDLTATAMAVGGVVVCVGVTVLCSVARAYLRFLGFWCRSNLSYLLWCIVSATLQFATEGTGSLSACVVVLASPLAFGGIDFLLLCGGGRSQALVKVFFVLNLAALLSSYVYTRCLRNLCEDSAGAAGASAAITVLFVFAGIARVGQLLRVIKIHVQKLRDVLAPALRYGVRSHVLVSLPRPGEPAVLLMGDQDLVVMPSAAPPAGGGSRRGWREEAHFVSPSRLFRNLVAAWAALVMVWVLANIAIQVSESARLRANPGRKCWTVAPALAFFRAARSANTPFAALLIVLLAAIMATHGLGRSPTLPWMAFWYRRNWVLVALSFLAGFVFFLRPGYRTLDWVGTLVNFSLLLPIAHAVTDIILILRPRFVFKLLYHFFILSQLCTAISAYLVGLSLDNPCDPTKLARVSSTSLFVLQKLQNAVFLFHSLYYLQLLLRIKLVEGLTIPIIIFSDKRFLRGSALPKHMISRLQGSTRDEEEDESKL